MASIDVRESEIEDIFAQYPDQVRRVLNLSDDVFLVARQKILPSGRLDLVYSHLSELLLVELKVEAFQRSFVGQVLGYRNDLVSMQGKGQFPRGNVRPIILSPQVTRNDRQYAGQAGVDATTYDPGMVLSEFYRNAPLDVHYLSVQPSDVGVWRIGLANETVCMVKNYGTPQEIARHKGQSTRTIGNQLRLAEGLGLIVRSENRIRLSSHGERFVDVRDPITLSDVISHDQAAVVRDFLLSDPFFSGITFGIITLVGSTFELSKNTYPVPLELLARHFISAAGLSYKWDSEKAVRKGVRMYTNYAVDLGLVGKVGRHYYVTPSGLKFVLLLNMHKSLKLIEGVKTID